MDLLLIDQILKYLSDIQDKVKDHFHQCWKAGKKIYIISHNTFTDYHNTILTIVVVIYVKEIKVKNSS